MANYVFAYSGGKGVASDEAERNAQMAKWGQWFGELGSAVVDGGAPTGTGQPHNIMQPYLGVNYIIVTQGIWPFTS